MPMALDSSGTNTLMRSRVYQYSYVQDNSNIGPEEGDLFRLLVSFQSSEVACASSSSRGVLDKEDA